MSPTSYQAAPPRVEKPHYRRRLAALSRNGAGAGSRGCRRRARLLEQKDDLAGTAETELFAGDRLDPVRVVAQRLDLGDQPLVLGPQDAHLGARPGHLAPL